MMNVTSNRNRTTRIARAAASIAVVAAMSLGGSVNMADARTVIGVVDSQAISAIDPTRSIDLTLIKTPPNPYEDLPVGDIPAGVIEGVTFTVLKVNGVDLTTEAGWTLARGMTIAQARQRGFSAEYSAVTDVTGTARFTGLGVGLYLVTETPPPNPNVNYERSAEFLITLPTGGDDGEHWNYDVTVYTKDKVKPTKPPKPTDPPTGPPIIPIPVPVPIPGGGSSVDPGPTPSPAPTTTPATPAPEQGTPPPTWLATTGANVAWLAVLALFLIGGGAFLIQRRRQ